MGMLEIAANFITFSNGKRHQFVNRVAEHLIFEDAVIVRLAEEPIHRSNENIFSFDHSGRLLWQIPTRSHLIAISPYVNIQAQGANVEALNMDGYSLTLRPHSGAVISEGYTHASYQRNSRQPSKRRWI